MRNLVTKGDSRKENDYVNLPVYCIIAGIDGIAGNQKQYKLAKDSLHENKSDCTYRESNPGQMLGRHLCYHYTTGAC